MNSTLLQAARRTGRRGLDSQARFVASQVSSWCEAIDRVLCLPVQKSYLLKIVCTVPIQFIRINIAHSFTDFNHEKANRPGPGIPGFLQGQPRYVSSSLALRSAGMCLFSASSIIARLGRPLAIQSKRPTNIVCRLRSFILISRMCLAATKPSRQKVLGEASGFYLVATCGRHREAALQHGPPPTADAHTDGGQTWTRARRFPVSEQFIRASDPPVRYSANVNFMQLLWMNTREVSGYLSNPNRSLFQLVKGLLCPCQ